MANNKFIRQIKIEADDQGALPKSIQLLHTGSWNTPWHGDFEINEGDINEFAENFSNGVGLPAEADGKAAINYSHYGGEKAAGWLTNVRAERVDGVLSLMGDPEWTAAGQKSLIEGEFRYISPEFNPRALPWEDPEEEWHMVANVLTGAGLTNRPLFKKLKKVAASEIKGSTKENKKEKPMSLKLEEVRIMEASELKDEHRAFLEDNKTQLSADELTKFGIKTVEAQGEQVQISANELAELKANASRGVEAADKLAQKEASDFAAARVQAGQVKSDQKTDLEKILLASSGEARTGLEAFLSGLPVNADINADELGDGGKTSVSASDELFEKADKIVADSQGKTSYNAAMKQVLASDKDLRSRVDEERK